MAKIKRNKYKYVLYTKDGNFEFVDEIVMNKFIEHLQLKDYKIAQISNVINNITA